MFQNIYENIKISLGFSSNIISKDLDIISNSLLNNSEQLYSFYFICFSILPLVGFSITLNNLTKANNFFQALFLSIFIIVTLLFIATFFSFYWQLKGTIILVGYILLSYNCFIFIKKTIINFWNTNLSLSQYFTQQQIKNTSYSIIFRIPDLIILVFPFYFLLVMRDLGMYGYDTFWHGMFSKHINTYGSFWNSESIILQSHMTTQPFFYLLQNLFLAKDIFDERVVVFANNFFVSIALLSLTFELQNSFKIFCNHVLNRNI